MKGATLKKKVTSAKHKPADGIAMPGGLTRFHLKLLGGMGVVWLRGLGG